VKEAKNQKNRTQFQRFTDMKCISVIIFARNVGTNFEKTYRTLIEGSKQVDGVEIQIIVVDDGSENFIEWGIDPNVPTTFLTNNSERGIAGAILTGLKFVDYDQVLLVPGHDVWTAESFKNVLLGSFVGDMVIGYRQNLGEERPILKQMASRVFRAVYRQFGYYFVADPHGLHLFKKRDLREILTPTDGHAFAVHMLASTIPAGRTLVQVPVFIKKGHKVRQDRTWKDAVPSPWNVIKVLIAILSPRVRKLNSDNEI
jgi:glycosyltransferase involved in cell wall biosynthesis